MNGGPYIQQHIRTCVRAKQNEYLLAPSVPVPLRHSSSCLRPATAAPLLLFISMHTRGLRHSMPLPPRGMGRSLAGAVLTPSEQVIGLQRAVVSLSETPFRIQSSACLETLSSKHKHRIYSVCSHWLKTSKQTKVNNCYFEKCFRVSAPVLWNKLPLALRELPTIEHFTRTLKALLFPFFFFFPVFFLGGVVFVLLLAMTEDCQDL